MNKSLLLLLLLLSNLVNAQTIEELQAKLKNVKNNNEASKIESDLGRAYYGEGNYTSAQNYFFKALKSAEKAGDKHLIGSACNNISVTYMETENYPQAEQFAKKAIALSKALNDPKAIGDACNALANVYYNQEKDSLAFHFFKEALKQALITKDSATLFARYKNLGAIYFETKDTLKGIEYLKKSQKYAPRNKAGLLFSSYMSLGQLYVFAGKNLDLGKKYLDSSAVYLPQLKEYEKIQDYYYTLYKYYIKKGNHKLALTNYEQYGSFRDSVVNIEKNARLSELNIKYETEKKQQTIKQQQFEITKRNYWLFGSLLGFLLFGTVVYLVYKNYKTQQDAKLKTEVFKQQELATNALFEGEQNERIRIARDLHDSIGQRLSAMKMKLNTLPEGKETIEISSFLDGTISEVRTISHNLLPEALQFGLLPALEDLCEKMSTPLGPKISLITNDYSNQNPFTKQEELSIYRIIQEILSNTIKHSDATDISIELSKKDNTFIIQTSDNGKGMDTIRITQSKGIGWKNISARVNLLRGKMDVNSQEQKGTQIAIAIPLK